MTTALPPSVRLEPGGGSLPRLVVSGPAGDGEVYLHGAHVTRWRPAGHDDVLFLSSESRYSSDKAIRGGVPLCFPWFGAHATDPDAASHGFARVADWSLESAEEDGEDVVVVLALADSPTTRASAWPHPFRATLAVTIGARLVLALRVENTGDAPVTYEEALHTYLAVGDVRRIAVTGLEGNRYIDKVAGAAEPVAATGDAVRLTGETDRIYLDTAGTTTVDDPATGQRTTVAADHAATTVLWNPWADKAAALADLRDDEWTGMVCVETSNVGPAAITLEPGASHTTTATIGVARHG